MKRGFFRRKQKKENNDIARELTQIPTKEIITDKDILENDDDFFFDPDLEDFDDAKPGEDISHEDTAEENFVEAPAEKFIRDADPVEDEDVDEDILNPPEEPSREGSSTSQSELEDENEILSEGYFVEEDDTVGAFEAALENYFGVGNDADEASDDVGDIVDTIINNTSEADVEAGKDIDKEKEVLKTLIEEVQQEDIEDSDMEEVEVEKENNMDKIIEQNVLMAVEHDQTSIAKLSESTGRIEKMLGKHGEDYTKELSKAFENLISKDPGAAATIFMAATVATLQAYDGDTDKMAEELEIDDRDITMAEYEFNARYKAN